MAVPYFNPHSLHSYAEKTYDPVISNSGSVLTNCSQRSGLAFGMEVQQTAANSYLNASNPSGERFHNPFSDYRFPKVLVRVLCHQEPAPSEPPGLSNKNKAQHSDENILYTSQSGLRIDRVWSMATNSHSMNANHSPLDATLKDSAGNGSSGAGRSTPQISTARKAFDQSEKRKASSKAYEQSEKRKAYQKAYRQSDKGKASHQAYRQSRKGQASRKAYQKSEKRKAARKAYELSEKGIAARRAYEQSKKRKAYQKNYQKAYAQCGKRKAYEQSEKRKAYRKVYQKAYNEVFNSTGDREQARIAGKQAAAFIRKSNKSPPVPAESSPVETTPSGQDSSGSFGLTDSLP